MEQNQDAPRRKLSPDQKFKIIKEQMTTKTAISDICKKYEIVPSQFYKWQEKFLMGALEGFKKSDSGPSKAELRKIDEQAKWIEKMQSSIAVIVQENIELKKSLGDSGIF